MTTKSVAIKAISLSVGLVILLTIDHLTGWIGIVH